MIPARLKQLKGQYRDFYQFDISRGDRLIYSVDEVSKTVYVEYIGKHPEWRAKTF
jgi:mRNA-degrading endonuclease YafQ of YafQ-DinJ toxin-antitoxin module